MPSLNHSRRGFSGSQLSQSSHSQGIQHTSRFELNGPTSLVIKIWNTAQGQERSREDPKKGTAILVLQGVETV